MEDNDNQTDKVVGRIGLEDKQRVRSPCIKHDCENYCDDATTYCSMNCAAVQAEFNALLATGADPCSNVDCENYCEDFESLCSTCIEPEEDVRTDEEIMADVSIFLKERLDGSRKEGESDAELTERCLGHFVEILVKTQQLDNAARQEGVANFDPYSLGMTNGIAFIKAVIYDEAPTLIAEPSTWLRYKARQKAPANEIFAVLHPCTKKKEKSNLVLPTHLQ